MEINAVSRAYNARLQMELESRPISAAIAKVYYVDIYSPIEQLIRRPSQFGEHSWSCSSLASSVRILTNFVFNA